MSHKKLALFIALSLLSIVSGAVFGLIDLFGFIDGRHALSLTLLIVSVLLIYLITIVVFILNFAERKRTWPFFAVAALLFSTTFFLMSLTFQLTIASGMIFLAFLYYAYVNSAHRSHLFIAFSPKEIFFPIIKTSFVYLMVILALLAYTQSRQLISQHSLVSPVMVKIISRPMVLTLNKQINSQLQSELGSQLPSQMSAGEKDRLIRSVLKQSVEAMAQNEEGRIYGFKPEEIPIENAIVYDSGEIDLTPVIDGMLPQIAIRLNDEIQRYAVFAPFVVAFIVILIIQPFIYPIELIEALLTLVIFKVILRSGFIKLTKETKEVDVIQF